MTATLQPPPTTFDPLAVRKDFPILQTQARGRPLVYLDNGATTQKPQVVIDAMRNYYEKQNANIHRGVYQLSQVATEGYEAARRTVQRFINAPDPAEVIFTRGTTEGINLVAHAFGRAFLSAGDEVVISALEHHSNIVPWQMACQASGATLRVIPINDRGELVLEEFAAMLSSRVKMVAGVAREQLARHAAAGRADRRHGPQRGGERADRRRAVGRPRANRRAGARLRLLRLQRSQGLRPDRHRRAVGPPRIAREKCRRTKAAATWSNG
jgi:hypothetical protein